MVGWGATGIAGALLARALRGREPGRLLLAVVCGLAGLAFGAWMDLYQLTLAAHQVIASVNATITKKNAIAESVGVPSVVVCMPWLPQRVRRSRKRRTSTS